MKTIIYDKTTKRIKGIFKRADKKIILSDFDKYNSTKYGYGVTEAETPSTSDYIVVLDEKTGNIINTMYRPIPYNKISLQTATPEIKADGKSKAIITIQKYRFNGEIENPETGSEKVIITSTRGYLSTLHLTLINGKGSFTLTSVPETVEAIIMVSADGFLPTKPLKIQFSP